VDGQSRFIRGTQCPLPTTANAHRHRRLVRRELSVLPLAGAGSRCNRAAAWASRRNRCAYRRIPSGPGTVAATRKAKTSSKDDNRRQGHAGGSHLPDRFGLGAVDDGDRGRLGGASTGAELSAPLNARLHRPPVREDVVSVAQVSLLPPTEAPHPQAPTKCVHETPPLPRADGPAVDRTTRLAGHPTYSGSGRLGCPRIAAPTQVALPAGWQARRARR
jgi:hypothetical protein